MARKLRVLYEGAIYHVTIRGVERRVLFDDDDDRERFVKRLGEAVAEYGVRLYLFCLMSNHVHLLVETPQANLSAFMHKLQTAYTMYYNLRHKRSGHLMQGRFGAKPVAGDEYLLKLSRYIHLNPVCVGGLVKLPLAERRKALRPYAWSSYRGYAGLAKANGFVSEGPIWEQMEVPAKRERMAYRRFVEAGLAATDTEFLDVMRASAWGIGDADFQERIRAAHLDLARQARRIEDVSFRRVEGMVLPERVLDAVAKAFGEDVGKLRRRRYDCVARAVAARLLGRYSGLNQRDVGVWLGMGTGAAVSEQLKRLREREVQEPELARQIAGLAAALGGAARGHGSAQVFSNLDY